MALCFPKDECKHGNPSPGALVCVCVSVCVCACLCVFVCVRFFLVCLTTLTWLKEIKTSGKAKLRAADVAEAAAVATGGGIK
jgi:hypothetical protein